jgi:putative nucleotidyltransferase with HDIG domain
VNSVAAPAAVGLEDLVSQSRERVSGRLHGRDRLATSVLAAAFLLVAVALPLAWPPDVRSWPLSLLLVAAYALSSRVEFEIGTGSAIPSQLLFVPLLFVLPASLLPAFVALALVAGSLPDVVRGRMHRERLAVVLMGAWESVGPALVLLAAGEPAASWSRFPILLAAVGAQFAFAGASHGLRGSLALRVSLFEQLRVLRWVYLVDAALSLVGFAIAVAAVGAEYASLVGVPLVALLAVFARERERRIDHALELSRAYRGTALLLGDVIEADDAYTGDHSRQVVELAVAVADELGLEPAERRDTELGALLHDVGKIRIPGELINKPGPLSPAERTLMETHTVEGERLLARVGGLLGNVGAIVRSCHEHYDGAGYPDGLGGERIPLAARIVACCDAFNAMTTDRPYRRAMPYRDAVAELVRCRGSQFDPDVVDALLRTLERSQ